MALNQGICCADTHRKYLAIRGGDRTYDHFASPYKSEFYDGLVGGRGDSFSRQGFKEGPETGRVLLLIAGLNLGAPAPSGFL